VGRGVEQLGGLEEERSVGRPGGSSNGNGNGNDNGGGSNNNNRQEEQGQRGGRDERE
jgi:hypothetical protein